MLKLIGAAIVPALVVYEAVAARRDRSRHPPPGAMVDVGGHRLHARCEGEGSPTVVFIAGAGATTLSWSLVQPEVAKLTRTCAYDRAGLGWSEGAGGAATVGRSAEELRVLLNALGEKPPYVFVPHSLAGAIAMHYATAHPDEVAGIVFVDAAYKELYERYFEAFPSWEKRISRGKWMMRAARAAAYLGIPRLARIKLGDAKLSPDDRAAANALGRRPGYMRAMYQEIVGLEKSRDSALSAPRRDLPVIVLTHSDPEAIFKEPEAQKVWEEMQRKLADRFDGASLREVADSKHFIQLDQPKAVTDAIEEVVQNARGARGPT